MRMVRGNQLLFLVLIFITDIVAVPIIQTIRCNPQRQNCSFSRNFDLTSTPRRYRDSTQMKSLGDFDSFSENLKRAAFILAGVALALGILRICLMLCRSRSSNSSESDQQSCTNRSSNDTQQFKPDLPPMYAEAIATIQHDGSKLPTYDELPYEQRQYQYTWNDNRGYSSS